MFKSVTSRALVVGLVGVVAFSGTATAASKKKTTTKKKPTTKAAPTTKPTSTVAPSTAAVASAACSKTGGTFRDGWNFAAADSTHYDPGLNTELIGAQINNMMFDGLTRVNALTGKLQANVAESFSSNAAGTVWTFKIRKGVKFSNGEDVLPSTFKKSWDRNVAPSFGSEYASLANIIDGYDAVASGKAKEMNVDANDASMTLTVNLAKPYGLFPNIVTHNLFFPLPKQAMELGADWETKGTLIGNGAFKLEKRVADQSARLVRNDTYFGGIYGGKACLDAVEMKVSKDPLVAYNDFLAGNTDGGPIPVGKWREATAKFGDKAAPPTLSINYLGFNWNDKTVGGFANTKLRQAIQASLDRDTINEVLNQGSASVALGFTPPGIAGYKAGLSKQPANSKADKALAKKLYDEWAQGKPTPKIEYHFRNNTGPVAFAQLMQAQVKDAIGLEITLKPEVPRGYFSRVNAENYQMFASGWIFDYNGYDNGMNELFATNDEVSNNSVDFSVAEFDKLTAAAKSEPNDAKSAALFNQSETLLLDTSIVIPTFHNRSQNVINDKVGTYPVTAFGFVEFQLVTMK
jgi:oligopeptide transport system substrate-binding protein